MMKRMLPRILLPALLALCMAAPAAWGNAQVDVNHADQAALDGVRGIGPKLSRTILTERKEGGDFKDWADFQRRVKGVGVKSAEKLSQAGLLVNGKAKPAGPEQMDTNATNAKSPLGLH